VARHSVGLMLCGLSFGNRLEVALQFASFGAALSLTAAACMCIV
jgi:hypothetical protein